MKEFLELYLFAYGPDSSIEVDSGWLQILPHVKYSKLIKFRVALSVSVSVFACSAHWETDDRLLATIQIDDHEGTRWEAEHEFSPDCFWLNHAESSIEIDPAKISSDWEEDFNERMLLHNINAISDSRWSKRYLFGDEVVEIFEKHLAYQIDVAYTVSENYSGEAEPEDLLLVRLKIYATGNNREHTVYYQVALSKLLNRGPFQEPWRFHRTPEPGIPQARMIFKPTPDNV